MQINWGILRPIQNQSSGALNAYMAGQDRNRERKTRNALAGLVASPDSTEHLETLAKYNPQAAMQFQEQRQRMAAADAKAQQDAQAQRLEHAPIMARLLEASTDEASYARNLSVAQQHGIDVSQVPQQFDPDWVQGTAATLKLMQEPEGQKALSTMGKQAMDEGLQPGSPEFQARVRELVNAGNITTHSVNAGGTIVQTNKATGETKAIVQGQGFGGGGGNIPKGAVEALKRGEGTPEQFDQMFGKGAAARVMGGTASNGGGGF